nr:FecR domain-containing protein [Marivibrio halodurans]
MAALIETPEDPEQLARFEAWRDRAPENARAWREMTRAYVVLGHVEPRYADRWGDRGTDGEREPVPLPTEAASRPRRVRAGTSHARSGRGRRHGRIAAAVAACACLLLAAVLVAPGGTSFPDADHATARAEIGRIVLPDGSLLHLAPESAVDIAYEDARRTVRLIEGRAFLEVEADPARPFLVEAEGLSTRVLGTAFEVHHHGSRASVAVREGTVAVRAGQGEWSLSAGEWARRLADGSVTRGRMAADQVAAWVDGRLVAKDLSVEELVEEVAHYYRGTILVRGETLSEQPVTGVFDLTDPAGAVSAIAAGQDAFVLDLSPIALVVLGE